jgi:hypothetical protein
MYVTTVQNAGHPIKTSCAQRGLGKSRGIKFTKRYEFDLHGLKKMLIADGEFII